MDRDPLLFEKICKSVLKLTFKNNQNKQLIGQNFKFIEKLIPTMIQNLDNPSYFSISLKAITNLSYI